MNRDEEPPIADAIDASLEGNWTGRGTEYTERAEPPPAVGVDDWGREWRLAPSGVEHQVRELGYIPRSVIQQARLFTGLSSGIYSWCGREINELPPSPDAGERRPCLRCQLVEYAQDDD